MPLTLAEPIGFASPPGETNRLFILEKPGRIVVITNLLKPTRTVFLDIADRVFHDEESGLLGIAFHPEYAENGQFFVTYTFSSDNTFRGVHLRLARFETSPTNPNLALPDSELPLFTQFDGDPWHEGGDLRFGSDGYLYVSTGDGGQFGSKNVQRIDHDFFGGILRLDVDKRPGNLPPNHHPRGTDNYAIPADNPFVDATTFNGIPVQLDRVRTEFYAVGLRNPWRFSFDPMTGDLYSNDTGSNFREEVNVIYKGVNYGWPFTEGSLTLTNVYSGGRKPETLLPPLIEYGYEGGGAGSGKAITAGLLYRGQKYPSLDGAYLFSDFWTGDIGMIRPGSSQVLSELKSLQEEVSQLEERLNAMTPELESRQVEWETAWLRGENNWTFLNVLTAQAANGTTLVEQPDSSILAQGALAWSEVYTITARTPLTDMTGIRLELLSDARLSGGGPGRAADGNVVLSEIEVSVAPAGDLDSRQPIRLVHPTADYAQVDWDVGQAVDLDLSNGWAISPAVGQPHEAVFEFDHPVGFAGGSLLTIVLKQNVGSRVTIGRFRVSVSTAKPPLQADMYPRTGTILRIPATERTPEEKSILAKLYRQIDPDALLVRERIEALRREQIKTINLHPAPIEWIARRPGIASFGIHPGTGDILLADMLDGVIRILRLQSAGVSSWPETLAETGIFSNLENLTPAAGVVPYSVNVPFWSDGAIKSRWFSVPAQEEQIVFNRDAPWEFPAGSVWVKHFDLEITNGVPSSSRRLETRVLVRNDRGVHGATYRWDREEQNAYLVPDEGESETILTHFGGAVRSQVWQYPSRAQCLQCHVSTAGHVLGFNTVQLNREVDYGGFFQNQIEAFSGARYLDSSDLKSHTLPSLAHAGDFYISREFRVRSYLDANCSHCHHPGGPGRSRWDARIGTPRTLTGLIDGMPIHGSESPLDRLIKPGSLEHSVLWRRLQNLGSGHMPPLTTDKVNAEAVELVGSWIMQDLPTYESYEQWQSRTLSFNVSQLALPYVDPDGDGVTNYAEYLVGTDPMRASDRLKLSIKRLDDRTVIGYSLPPNVGGELQWKDQLSDASSWQPLEVPGNRPSFLAFPAESLIEDRDQSRFSRFYRLNVREP